MEILNKIQKELKAPKSQFNSFGKYNYRNLEDILEAVKPLLGTATLILSDEVVAVGNRVYVKATAVLKDGDKEVSATALAREATDRKGMDDSQLTGSTSSYARKYCLNGLFLIDDNKDADTMDKPVAKTAEPTSYKEILLNKVKHFTGKEKMEIGSILTAINMMTGEDLEKEDLTQDKCKQLISKCK